MNDKEEKRQKIQDDNYVKVKEWPIEPRFLSLRDGITDKYSASPNNDGLFYASELRGILANASAELLEKDGIGEDDVINGNGRIFALFQVVPNTFTIENNKTRWFVNLPKVEDSFISDNILKKQKIIRIHPGNLYPNLKCCRLFRNSKYIDEAGKKQSCGNLCSEMDSRIALLYDDRLRMIPKNKNGENDWNKFNIKLKEIIKEYNKKITTKYGNGDSSLKFKPHSYQYNGKTENRPYVGYRCVYSGLMEYFFPIIHENKIVAVLMHGQCVPPGHKQEEMFKNYRTQDDELDNWIKKFFYLFYKQQPIEKQLNHISNLIKDIEERIENEVKARSRKYVSDNFFEIERQFRIDAGKIKNIFNDSDNESENLRKEIANLDNDLLEYKTTLNQTLKSIVAKFDLNGFIRIYAIESPIANKINPKKDGFNIIGDSDFKENLNPAYSKIIFNRIKNRKGTIDKKELLEKLGQEEPYFPEKYWRKVDGFTPKSKDIFCVEFSFSPQIAYIIWGKYDNLDINSKPYEEYNKYLELMLHTVLEPYIIFERMKLEKNLESTMRISSHESAQIIPDVIDTINCQETLKFLKDEIGIYAGPFEITILAKTAIDASRRLSLLNKSFKRLSNIFKGEKPNYKDFDLHRIIYALESLFKEKAYLNKCQSIMIKNDEDLKKYSLRTDYDYLSHILFNLMDNAIKHSLQGSNIQINTHFHYKTVGGVQVIGRITISVVSYGNKIEDGDNEEVFELYYRSKNAKGTEGMGIGLFLVKKLCNLLGYEIKCMPSELIEKDYNLPIKYHYHEQNKGLAKDTSLSPKSSEILGRWIRKDVLRKVINTDDLSNDWEITVDDLQREPEPGVKAKLFQPTYKNEFKITIPINEINVLKRIYLI